MSFLEKIRYLIRKVLFSTTGMILSLIPKDKKLVLLTAWFGQKYIDNTKYVYEYLLKYSGYKVTWITSNKAVYEQLKKEGKPVEMNNSLKGIWLLTTAQVFFSTVQYSDYNSWFLKNCIYIDLGHGHPIKNPGVVGETSYMRSVYNMITKRLNYYAVVASTNTKISYNVVNVPQDHIFVSDYARNDVLFNESLRVGQNESVEKIKNGKKAIVYMPTHRSNGQVGMPMSELLPLDSLQEFCEKQNCVFIVKKHFYHRNEKECFEGYSNIFDITPENIDPQVLLYQTDILVTDYSACFIDYMLLRRPLIFYHYDYDYFALKERSFYINFKKINIAPIAYNQNELINCLLSMATLKDDYLERRMEFAQKTYFDNINHSNACAKIKLILDTLVKNNVQ